MALYTNIKGPINYTTVGSPTIENGVVSELSRNDYLSLPSFPLNYVSFEINIKFSIYEHQVSRNVLYGKASSFYVFLDENSTRVYLVAKNTNQTLIYNIALSFNQLSLNQIYIVNIKYDGISAIITLKDNDNNIIKTKTVQVELAKFNEISYFGNYDGLNPTCYIDLNETYININGNAWFGTSFSKVKLHSQSAITYTKVGNVSITDDGVATGFTDKTDYLTLPAFNPGTSKWKFTTKVKIYDMASQISLIDRNSSTRCFQIVVRTTKKFRVNISTNGSAKANEVDGTKVLSTNTLYYICFEYDGSKYYLKVSEDNINWTTDITINNSTKIYPVSSMSMGHSWYNSGTEKWNGEIYLRYTRFIIEGSTVDTWKLHCLEGN